MNALRNVACVLLLSASAGGLAGCDTEALRGTRGLPPAPENVAYPNVGVTPPQRPGRLKTPEEQKRLEAELLERGKR